MSKIVCPDCLGVGEVFLLSIDSCITCSTCNGEGKLIGTYEDEYFDDEYTDDDIFEEFDEEKHSKYGNLSDED